MSQLLETTPGVTDVRDTLGAFQTEARFVADQEALSFYGLDEGSLLEQVRFATVADKVGAFQRPGPAPDLDIRVSTAFESRAEDGEGPVGGPRAIYELETLTIITPQGERVPLAALVDVSLRPTPMAILHAQGERAVTVKAAVDATTTAAAALAAFRPRLEALAADWPASYAYSIRGEAEASADSYGRTRKALLLALFLVFAVVALLLGSFRQPLIIMAMAPLSLTGVFCGFAVLGIPMSFAAMIGVIALIGIVVNDAIVMVEVINKRRSEGLSQRAAAAHGASDRLRPILTTSITTIVGLTPLAFSSPAWYPLCMAIILGLLVATVFALMVIPALYVVLEGADKRAATPLPDTKPTPA